MTLIFPLICIAPLLAEVPVGAAAGRPDEVGGFPSTHILFRLKPQAHAAVWKGVERRGGVAAADGSLELRLSRSLRATCARWGVTNVRPAFVEGFAHPDLAAKYGLDRLYVAEVPVGTDTPAMATAISGHDEEVDAASVDAIGEVAQFFPNDPNFSIQYSLYNDGTPDTGTTTDACPEQKCAGGVRAGLACAQHSDCPGSFCNTVWCVGSDIDAPDAWELSTGSPDVIVAILDSGVTPHAEFTGRLLAGRNFASDQIPTNTTDACNGLIGHGTHVAGIAAASGNNGQGTAGVAWNVKILPVRVVNGNCAGSAIDLADGITYAADQGADILNISLQFYPSLGLTVLLRNLLQDTVNYAHDAGAVVVAAAGNSNQGGIGVVAYPGASDNTLAVSATNACDQFATQQSSGFFSNFGPQVDVSAPGDDIYSTTRTGGYNCLSGTSMATPVVSGIAALVKSYVPELTNTSVENIIKSTTLDLGNPGWDDHYGFGRVDAFQALLAAAQWPQISASALPPNAIDAGWPHPPDDTSVLFGWRTVELTFRGDVTRLSENDFSVVQEGGITATPIVFSVIAGGEPNTVVVELDGAISPAAWTSIQHDPSGTKLRLGYLPGDVTSNRRSDEVDIAALSDALDGVGDPRPTWSTDINRSGAMTSVDLIDLVDLLNGANFNEPYLGRTLPAAR